MSPFPHTHPNLEKRGLGFVLREKYQLNQLIFGRENICTMTRGSLISANATIAKERIHNGKFVESYPTPSDIAVYVISSTAHAIFFQISI